jgi:hypothetical protein
MIEYLQRKRMAVGLALAALAVSTGALAADPEPANPIAEVPKKIAVGTNGLFQPGLLLQGWYVFDQVDATGTAPGSIANTFRVRRAEIALKGEIIPGMVAYNVMFDPARVREPTNTTATDSGGDTVTVKAFPGAAAVFQDLYVTFIHPFADVSIGQFKIPVSWEGYNSSAKIVFPERSLVGSAYGDKRDLGIRVTKTFKNFMYSAGIFNGAVSNNLDTNNSKDLGLRLEYYPLDGLTVAAVGYASIGERLSATTKDRWEFDAATTAGRSSSSPNTSTPTTAAAPPASRPRVSTACSGTWSPTRSSRSSASATWTRTWPGTWTRWWTAGRRGLGIQRRRQLLPSSSTRRSCNSPTSACSTT